MPVLSVYNFEFYNSNIGRHKFLEEQKSCIKIWVSLVMRKLSSLKGHWRRTRVFVYFNIVSKITPGS